MKKLLFFTFILGLLLAAITGCAITCNHTYSGACDTSCNKCKAIRTTEAAHTYANCDDTACDTCGETRETAVHSYKGECATKCTVCGSERTGVAAHTYSGACDTDCNVCEETRVASEHTYDSDCDVDCNVCDATREAIHTYTNACDKTCNFCGTPRIPEAHVYSNACDTTCDICGELRIAANHEYAAACDAACDICGELRIAATHTYDHACDPDCNVCGAERSVSEHTYDDACDAICNNCGTPRENVHNFSDWSETTAASCEAAGVESRYCLSCGTTETREIGEPLDHVYDNACDVACNRNGCDYTREITHIYVTEFVTKVPASCTTDEILHRFCHICTAEETKIGKVALGHDFENDCDADCGREGCDFVRVIDPHDHNYGEWETLTPADCLNAEVEHRVCADCSIEEIRTGDVLALDHDFDNACDTDCNRDGCDFTRVTEHAFDAWTTLSPATCTQAEVEEQICSVCGVHNPETRVGDAALDHDYGEDPCDAICNREDCGFERIPPHAFENDHDVTCQFCDYVRPCNGHNASSTDCTVCKYCGEAIPDSSHTYSNLCDTDCDVCGSVRTVGPHQPSQENCTVCLYCGKTIEDAAHLPFPDDCTKCQKCDAGTGIGHTASEENCLICGICGKDSGIEHTPAAEDCTKCGECGAALRTAHNDSNADGKCDNCEQEALPGDNWFPWAPL